MKKFSVHGSRSDGRPPDVRFRFLLVILSALFLLIVVRLAKLQVSDHALYEALASNQHDLEAQLLPTRGRILVRDRADGNLYPFATNREAWMVYAVPRNMEDPISVAHELSAVLTIPDVDIVTKLTRDVEDPYEVIAKDVKKESIELLREKGLEGVGYVRTAARLYPERGVSGQLIGFVGPDESGALVGKYGIEGGFDELLAGTVGSLIAEKDASGRRLIIGDSRIQEAVDGSDVVLTIDRTIQYEACTRIKAAVERHSADMGTILVMEPATGAILAMCSYPDFDSAEYNKVKDLSVLNNPAVFVAYEPGSVFKPVTYAAGIHAEKIGPKTTYEDTGAEEIDDFTIRNSDGKAYGVQTMTQALDESLNTGTIFVQRQLGKDLFRSYVEAFGFGKSTGIELSPEGKGNISSLEKRGQIFAATGSYGQGLTVTPIQLITAYGALANGGKLMRPYVVEEIRHPDGAIERTKPQEVGTPIDPRTSRLISGMMVSVVENGHGSRAGVPGYWVAGKTGTAQVAKKGRLGYEKDETIGSFAGYAPASDPKFVMLVKIDHPKDVTWAESSAAPLFGEMASFLLKYMHVPPERPIGTAPAPEPEMPAVASSGTAI
ncbi:penicillin-binding protein 2 [Patescibacteria group bacterium]|nr:penicillin-binding protein 2 [Patescibacteria group bacterium]MBU1448533.1 penicillin-binding protein 2 [Patescibacteria group bacterium]MBU2613716.1 penicillin-binding protein 2 [Patescibacteria group bacterium]